MIQEGTVAYENGRNAGFKGGMFQRDNPYNPITAPKQFHEWEAGFTKGYQSREWL